MNAATDLVTSEREAIKQYADWYSQQGYQVSVEPSPRELPEFLRTLAPDMIARRDGENIVVEIKTSCPASLNESSGWPGHWNIVPVGGCRSFTPISPIRNGRHPRNCRIFRNC
jgi:hypothetical protein